MLNRRELLVAVTAALAGCSKSKTETSARAAPASLDLDTSEQLAQLFDRMFDARLARSPETVTQLGMDKGDRVAAKSQLDDASLAAFHRDKANTRAELARLAAIDRSALTGSDAVNYDIVRYVLKGDEARFRRFNYGGPYAGMPYVLSQLTGAYTGIPGLLRERHVIETRADADAYLARLAAFAEVLDQETEWARHDAALGVIPPDFVIDRTLAQMKGLLSAPEVSPLVSSLAQRAQQKKISGDYAGKAAGIYTDSVVPALNRQISFMRALRARAVHDAGVWRLPDGEAYYQASLEAMTTTKLSAEEVHQLGLDQVRELTSRADALLRSQGHTRGTVGERIQALTRDPRYLYANTQAGRTKLIADLNTLIVKMNAQLPQYFGTLPKSTVEVRRVPEYIEEGGPGGGYGAPPVDGSRPAIYWINLRDTSEHPTWTLPTLTYHEAVPGHHLQTALQLQAALPQLRLLMGFFSAFSEGWALYAEQLAREMGVYANDPLGELGYLQAALFRAGRLVVDTGLHFKRWSRERAIDTMRSFDGSPLSAATTEIERYCVVPGQACSYMVGKLAFLRLREKTRAALGERFDIRRFHDTVLLNGGMPLSVIEAVVDQSISANRT